MGSRGLVPLLLLPIRPMCAKGIARKKTQYEASKCGACHHVKAFFFLLKLFFSVEGHEMDVDSTNAQALAMTFTNLEKFNNILQQNLGSLLFRCVNLN